MKQDVATFVSKCMTCQQVKIEHQRASGLLQPLEIPMWKWDEISMDFVTGLPTTQKRHDAIWVVVDRLTKSAHFLPIRKNYGISKLAEIFRQEIVRLHGTPTSIVSDRDPKFTSHFWKGLQKAWGTRLKFSTTFHPQTDGQSERTIQTLEDMLRACALEWTGSWDEYLCLVEFAYNNSWHASIKAAPFELLYGRKCRAPICWDEVGERLIEGPELIEITNEKVAFQVGDRVFLKVSPFRGVKRFGIKGKLSPRFIGPFEILERIGEVSYRLALPPQLSHAHDVFHLSLLRGYHYHPLHVASYPFDQIQPDMSLSEEPESILDRYMASVVYIGSGFVILSDLSMGSVWKQELGYSGKCDMLSAIHTDQMHQPRRTFKNVDYVALLWEDFMYQADNRKISSAQKEHMPYLRFTKVIVNHFISKDKIISMRNMINLHTVRDDSLLGTLKFVSKTKDYQKYGELIPDGMINEDIKDSKAYKTYYDFATRKATPKKSRKFKKVSSPSKKL
ncbi:putative nucleotidyltransferase, ribonuclease H [Tanacetum coccineum]